MNDSELLISHEKRLADLESAVTRLSAEVGKAEDKASSAWNRIREIGETMKVIDSRLDKLEQNMIQIANRVEQTANTTNASIEKLKKAFICVGICAVVALVYSIVQEKVTADSILNAVAAGAKMLA